MEKSFSLRKIPLKPKVFERSPRRVSLKTLLKGTSIIMVAPLMLLAIYVLYGVVPLLYALYGAMGIFVISIIFVWPYIANLSALTYYVEQLANDKKADAPDLTFLNNVEDLSRAVEQLHKSWNQRRVQLENMLAESKILIDSLPDILIMLDRDLNVIRTNSTAQMAFGGYMKENISQLLHAPEFRKHLEGVIAERKGRSTEYAIPDPEMKDYMVRIEPLPVYAPTGIALIVALHDITELKRTEQTFADFVANASHEIRTPLTSIIGFVETLQTSAKSDAKAQEEFLALMALQAQKMSTLVTDLLSLSKIERRLRTIPATPVKIGPILQGCVQDAEAVAKKRKIGLVLNLPKNLPSILGDSEELTLVFNNLLSNAIKYSPEGSSITVSAREGEFILPHDTLIRAKRPCLAISVTDTGAGIPREHLPRLTERFYRVDSARTKDIAGTGLGLSIVKQVLERHRGVLHIESHVGKGSTFTAVLPLPQ